ncbi:MAG TPA: VPLPA-CTERM sorting domain-containing protein [Thermodesulfobacteriota bacterium]|nr:VPLPA-CTERM sorting domain-containing protein [Deltaproteobacteria bacterium]HNR12451.1 VPLPA-CTERM sorting domain-containing protein [Thermodesulfobacteriota bacterium]HNU70795.1 VPLPA-CTERM sorting domain-containing protein [Thermodesulfobacteriota bacterium]
MMKTRVLPLLAIFAAAIVLAFGSTPSSAALTASGTLNKTDGTLVAAESGSLSAWANPVLTWTIDQTDNIFTYTYSFSNGNDDGSANLSHMTIETSPDFDSSDLLDGTTFDGLELPIGNDATSPATIDGNNQTIYGVKWEVDDVATLTATIVTTRAPVWGDVFLKDGGDTAATNSGYALPDPVTPVTGLNITGYGFVGVPDTATVVPLPGALWMLGGGLIGLAGIRRRACTGSK